MITENNLQSSNSYAIGIDLSGSSLKCGLVCESGEIITSFSVSLKNSETETKITNLIVRSIQQCAKEAKGEILGVGIGFPGIIKDDIIIAGSDNLPPFKQTNLGQTLKNLTGYNIVIDNNANFMGLGELIYGAAKDCNDAIFLTVSTGIGGAIMIDKKLFRGFKNSSAELGHIVVQQNGYDCSCGGRGCLEVYASLSAMILFYQNKSKSSQEDIDFNYIIEKYRADEKNAVDTMEMHFNYLAAGISSLVNVFSPQKIIIGGDVNEAGQFYINKLKRKTQSLAIPINFDNLDIVSAELGNNSGILGGCATVFQKFNN